MVCVDKCPLVADYYSFICRYDLQEEADGSLTAGYEYVPARQCMYVIQVRPLVMRYGRASIWPFIY